MSKRSRKVVDGAFTGASVLSVLLLAAALLVILVPIMVRGSSAYFFRGTVEFRRLQLERFSVGDRAEVEGQVARADAARKPVYDMIAAFEQQTKDDIMLRLKYAKKLARLKELVRALLGPLPGEGRQGVVVQDQYGATRWDRTQVALHDLLYSVKYDYSDPTKMGVKSYEERADEWKGTALEPLFAYAQGHAEQMLLPQWTFYWRFLTQEPLADHRFGGIWPALLGTLYLTVGAMIFAIPMGVIAAIYLVEYTRENWFISLLRSCISTLAGVPSIVFGLFGYTFFIHRMHVSSDKSVLAGSLTLALLVLPTVIRASEEALRAVPATYREAALSLGAGKWRTVVTVLLPASLPGILTGIVLSMGRAAGETAPIIFTAAVSAGASLKVWQVFTQPTPALSWGVYSLCAEHKVAEQIRYVQYGMVATLILLVLLLNTAAFVLRARISKKLRG